MGSSILRGISQRWLPLLRHPLHPLGEVVPIEEHNKDLEVKATNHLAEAKPEYMLSRVRTLKPQTW